MNVNDYVRTKYGISKCIKVIPIRENSFMYEFDREVYEDVNFLTVSELEKYKSSPNKIDLLEVGDYVNGHRVCDSSYGLIIVAPTTDIWEMNSIKDEFKNNDLFVEKIYKLEDIEIKSVITKEQFESMEYKVGE